MSEGNTMMGGQQRILRDVEIARQALVKAIDAAEAIGPNAKEMPLMGARFALGTAIGDVYRHVLSVPDEYFAP